MSGKKASRGSNPKVDSVKDLDKLYKNERGSVGDEAAFFYIKGILQSFDADKRSYLAKKLEAKIALLEKPYIFEFIPAPAATLIGSACAIAVAAVTVIAGMASVAAGAGTPEGFQTAIEIYKDCGHLITDRLLVLVIAAMMVIILPFSIHKMVLRERLERYYLFRSAF